MSRRRASPRRVPPFLAISVVGHGLVFLLLIVTGAGKGCVGTGSGLVGAPNVSDKEPEAGWDALCLAEELFVTGAQTLTCMVPGAHGTPSCEDPWARFELAKTACRLVAKPIDITMIDPEPLNPFAVRPDEPKTAQELLEEEKKKEEDLKDNLQIVDIPKPANEIRPDDPQYHAEFDSKVDKETRGRASLDRGAARPEVPEHKAQPAAPPAPPPKPAEPARPKAPSAGALAMRSDKPEQGTPQEKKLTPGGSADGFEGEEKDPFGPHKGDGAQATNPVPAPPPGSGEQASQSPPQPPSNADLRPSQEAIVRAIGGSGSPDFLKDVDDGEETLLNTKRFKYANFFNRIKRAVAQNWHPDVAYRLRDPSGQIYGMKNRLTVLKVSLHPNGTIRDVLVEKPCGVEFLDDEAVTAFKAAQPFPNPPAALVDKDSQLITFRFGFYFEVNDGTKFKVFRYSN